MMRIPGLLLPLSFPLLLAVACDDESPADSGTDLGGGEDSGIDTGGETDTGMADMGVTDTGQDTGSGDTGAPDLGVRGTCETFDAAGGTITFDVVTPLQKFVGTADVTVDGSTVSVFIPVEGEDPTTFEGDFDEDSNCVTAEVDDNLTAALCFYTADGVASEPGVMGPNLYAFIAGAPRVRPTATLLGAIARGADRSCSAGGWYDIDNDDLAVTEGTLDAAVVDAAVADFAEYFAIFDQGSSFLAVTGTAEPGETAFDEGNPLAGDIQLEVATFFVHDSVTYDVDLDIEATLDLETGVMTGTLELFLDDAAGTEGTISGAFTGTRN